MMRVGREEQAVRAEVCRWIRRGGWGVGWRVNAVKSLLISLSACPFREYAGGEGSRESAYGHFLRTKVSDEAVLMLDTQ